MAKNIVICCDGTNNEIVGNQTNVLRLFRMLDRSHQLLFYDAGVGTKADPTAQWPWRRMVRKRLDSAIGVSIRTHVLDAYRFLVKRFRPGDQIFLFGFSRGAYTVRALAAMIRNCGLLCPEFENLADYAWAVFTDEDRSGDRAAQFGGPARIKKVFGREVRIHFVGVWDTVSAFGWIWDLLTIPNTRHNDAIDSLRHAVSIDERRSTFSPNLFEAKEGQDCKQVWFAGVHADVGGGYADTEAGLARISLEWMVREAECCGLHVNPEKKQEMLHRMGRANQPDALGMKHDESLKAGWRLIGWFPRRAFKPKGRQWQWPNWAKPRTIPAGSNIHRSVSVRMQDAALRYRPNLPKDHIFVD